jgi:hypothetical protein
MSITFSRIWKGDNDQSRKGFILSHRINQLLRRRLLFQFSLFLSAAHIRFW